MRDAVRFVRSGSMARKRRYIYIGGRERDFLERCAPVFVLGYIVKGGDGYLLRICKMFFFIGAFGGRIIFIVFNYNYYN